MPEVTSVLLRDYCLERGWEPPAAGTAFLFGLRNAVLGKGYHVTPGLGRINQWDDTIGMAGTGCVIVPGTTDPGLPYTLNPLNRQGAAWLVPGVYRYKIGKHKLLPALVQAGPVRVRRDRNRDGRPQDDEPEETGWFGINIHRGGSQKRPVGPWSAGCQVVPQEHWPAFWAAVQRSGQQEFTYVLIDALLLWRK